MGELEKIEDLMDMEREVIPTISRKKFKARDLIGSRRNLWLKNLRGWFGSSNNELFKAAV